MTKVLGGCPICGAIKCETLYRLKSGILDASRLYSAVILNGCVTCGHVFNDLSEAELEGLNVYYESEYAPSNLSSITEGDRPGSASPFTNNRYNHLYKSFASRVSSSSKILDVGCATGGFLDYLNKKGFSRLSGVEMTAAYVTEAKKKKKHHIKQGTAEEIPFAGQSFDVVVLEQVLEHLSAPAKAFSEARRVLRKNGIFCVGVPDASRYADFYFFDFYWLLLKEHVQHFDIVHLKMLAAQFGFTLLRYYQTVNPVMSPSMVMPNLCAVFELSNNKDAEKTVNDVFELKKRILKYVTTEQERSLSLRLKISKLAKSKVPVYVWGIGREFLYLYETLGLKNCNIKGLIDANPLKQKACSVDGIKIVGGEVLRVASAGAVVIVAAIAHVGAIQQSVRDLGFKGEIFDMSPG